MKIKPEHYDVLRKALQEVRKQCPDMRDRYTAIGRNFTRFCWDALWSAPIAGYRDSGEYLCKVLYPYLSDTHIETALRRIANELWVSST